MPSLRRSRSVYVSEVLRPKKQDDFEICMDAKKFRSYHIRLALDPVEGKALCGVFCNWNSGFPPVAYNTVAPVQEWWCAECLVRVGGMEVLKIQDQNMRIESRANQLIDGDEGSEMEIDLDFDDLEADDVDSVVDAVYNVEESDNTFDDADDLED